MGACQCEPFILKRGNSNAPGSCPHGQGTGLGKRASGGIGRRARLRTWCPLPGVEVQILSRASCSIRTYGDRSWVLLCFLPGKSGTNLAQGWSSVGLVSLAKMSRARYHFSGHALAEARSSRVPRCRLSTRVAAAEVGRVHGEFRIRQNIASVSHPLSLSRPFIPANHQNRRCRGGCWRCLPSRGNYPALGTRAA